MPIDHPLGNMGWGDPNLAAKKKLDIEKAHYDRLSEDCPVCYRARPVQELPPEILKAWNDFQLSKGREAGSNDLTLMTEFLFKKLYEWFPQDTGSCVFSNSFRPIVDRMIFEVIVKGDPEEFFGHDESGVKSIAPHMISYGWGRQRANMKSGDGLYCQPIIETFMKDGLLMCSNPKLKELMDKAGATSPEDYPEPRSTGLIRRLQNWEFNDALRPYGDNRLLESVAATSGADILANGKAFKPTIQCSDIAIKVKEKSPDGFTIHVRDTNTSWGHNMAWEGIRVDKRGNIFGVLSNRSWIRRGDSPEKYVYNIPMEEVDNFFKHGVDCMSLGEFDLPHSVPVLT